ncbi:MAG TPA: hypothetical protein VI076_06950, partial [Actinopolymorphaceae bacterium]
MAPPRLLYLSRGHGYGHAATDLEIIDALRRRGAEVVIASYGTGAEYYRERDVACTDLRIDDVNDQGVDAALRILAFLRRHADADLVLAHEVFAAPRMCVELGLRNVLMTHWFFSELGAPERDRLLAVADELVFVDFEAAHRVPAGFAHTVFAGAVARRFDGDRRAGREALDFPDDRELVVLTTGAVTPYNEEHLRAVVDTVVRAWRRYRSRDGALVILSDVRPDVDDPSVRSVGRVRDPAPYYQAADVVVANATFSTICTLARNDVPTVVVTGGRNPVDRLHADFFASTGHVRAVEVGASAHLLWSAVEAVVT